MQKTLDDFFTDWETEVFGYGYGTGEDYVMPALAKFLSLVPQEGAYDYNILEKAFETPVVAWLLINTLCEADILDYGTSPRHGWLTKSGRTLKKYFATNSVEHITSILWRENYIGCGSNFCNCEENNPCKNPFFEAE